MPEDSCLMLGPSIVVYDDATLDALHLFAALPHAMGHFLFNDMTTCIERSGYLVLGVIP